MIAEEWDRCRLGGGKWEEGQKEGERTALKKICRQRDESKKLLWTQYCEGMLSAMTMTPLKWEKTQDTKILIAKVNYAII